LQDLNNFMSTLPTADADVSSSIAVDPGTDEPWTVINGETYTPSEKSNGSGPSSLSSLTSLEGEAEVRDLHAMTAPGVPHVEKSAPSHILSPERAAGLEDISVNVNTPLKPLNAAAGIGPQSSLHSTPSNRGTAALSHFIEETTYVPLQPSLIGPAHFPAQR
jgi:hypothetical protein